MTWHSNSRPRTDLWLNRRRDSCPIPDLHHEMPSTRRMRLTLAARSLPAPTRTMTSCLVCADLGRQGECRSRAASATPRQSRRVWPDIPEFGRASGEEREMLAALLTTRAPTAIQVPVIRMVDQFIRGVGRCCRHEYHH